jgi:hypothetical protein
MPNTLLMASSAGHCLVFMTSSAASAKRSPLLVKLSSRSSNTAYFSAGTFTIYSAILIPLLTLPHTEVASAARFVFIFSQPNVGMHFSGYTRADIQSNETKSFPQV